MFCLRSPFAGNGRHAGRRPLAAVVVMAMLASVSVVSMAASIGDMATADVQGKLKFTWNVLFFYNAKRS
jgi:cytochrome b